MHWKYRLVPTVLIALVVLLFVGATTPPGGSTRTVYTDPNYPLVVRPPDGTRSAQGDTVAIGRIPVVSIDATYGLTERQETFSGTGGSVSASSAQFVCASGTSVGGYGVIRSSRAARVRPGNGATFRFDAIFDSAQPANSLQAAFAFNAISAYGFGVDGSNGFGVFRRYGGAIEIRRLTISAAASGAETATVTLNSVPISVALTSGTTAHNAFEVAADPDFDTALWDSWQNDSEVTFIYTGGPGAKSGTYSFATSMGGTAAGSFETIQAGAANTYEWTYQADWNADTMLGSWATNLAGNPSHMLLDRTKINNYEVRISPGGGPVYYYVLGDADTPSPGEPVLVHASMRGNDATTPNARAPYYNVGWTAASLGSSTAMTVKGSYAMASIDGERASGWNPKGQGGTNTAVTTSTWVNVLSVRNRGEFASTVNLGEVWPERLAVFTDSLKGARFRLLRNATFNTASIQPVWTYVDQTDSIVEYTEGGMPFTDQGEVVVAGVAGTTSALLDLTNLEIVLERGDTLTLAALVVSGSTSQVTASMTWREDW